MIDETHAPELESWVDSANGHADFPIQNLPFGIVSTDGGAPNSAVAIGDEVLLLGAAIELGLFEGDALAAARLAARKNLNAFLGAGGAARVALRRRLSAMLRKGAPEEKFAAQILRPQARCVFHVPARVGDYTDFYAGIHHARAVGTIYRPDTPLLPNYKYVPIGYHGRASTIHVSGHSVPRPAGQIQAPGAEAPSFGPSRALDYELEVGLWIAGSNPVGTPVPIGQAGERLAGISLLNDWSARDIQRWEYQPLGPFLAKSFFTTVSPWIVTAEALAPFRARQPDRPEGDPAPLPYLWDDRDQAEGAFDIDLEAYLSTARMRVEGMPPYRLNRASMLDLYWTPAQLIAHHSSNGCGLNPGDLLGSGTISGLGEAAGGCLLELTKGGREALALPNGESRTYLEDGDRIILRGRCARAGCAAIGFGEAVAEIVAA
jgi:fumarylacetoacetase